MTLTEQQSRAKDAFIRVHGEWNDAWESLNSAFRDEASWSPFATTVIKKVCLSRISYKCREEFDKLD